MAVWYDGGSLSGKGGVVVIVSLCSVKKGGIIVTVSLCCMKEGGAAVIVPLSSINNGGVVVIVLLCLAKKGGVIVIVLLCSMKEGGVVIIVSLSSMDDGGVVAIVFDEYATGSVERDTTDDVEFFSEHESDSNVGSLLHVSCIDSAFIASDTLLRFNLQDATIWYTQQAKERNTKRQNSATITRNIRMKTFIFGCARLCFDKI